MVNEGSLSMVVPWYHGRFWRGTTILVNSDKSPEVYDGLVKVDLG